MSKKNKGWPVVALIVENTTKDGKVFRSVKFPKDVEILVDGEKVDMNKYRNANLVSPTSEVERLIECGAIDEKDQEFRREKAAEVESWLKYNVVVPPQKD